MSVFVNDRDVLIQATVPRYLVSVADKALLLAVDTPVFAVSAGGSATPAAITITATLVSITGTVEFSVSPGAALTVDGQVATLQFGDMGADVVFVQAKVKDVESGADFLRSAVISKVFDGAAGANGATYYTWVKYADGPAGAGLSDDPAGKKYIGLAYNKSTPLESVTPADYAWSLIKGADGQPGSDGENGLPGAKGNDGQTFYTWIKYADAPDGAGMYDVPNDNTMYLGLSTNRPSQVESANPADYVWSKFKGAQGVPGTAAPTLYTWLKYADSAAGAGLSDDPAGKAFIGLAYNKTTAVEGTNPADYAWALMKGTDGQPGGKGADGQTLYTWIKYADFPDGTGLYDLPGPTTMYVGLSVNRTVQSESGNKEDYVWSKFRGDQGVPGTTGPQGQRGTKTVVAGGYSTWSDASAAAELAAAGFGAPINRDVVTLYGPVNSSPTFTMTKFFDNGSWVVLGTHLDGGLLVKGTVGAEALSVDRLSALSANLGNVTAGDLYGTTLHGGSGYVSDAYAWPASGIGFHLSERGLLLGNRNLGAYVELRGDGYVAMPGLTVEGGKTTFTGNIVSGAGTGFRIEQGPDDPVYAFWAGSGAKNDVNAIFYIKRNGDSYFGGALTAGTLRTAVTSPEINPNAQLINGPFGSNGGLITVICSFDWRRSLGSTRAKYTAGAGSTQAVVRLYRGLAGAPADVLLANSTFTGPPAAIENTLIFDEMSTCTLSVSGAFTFTDDAHSAADHTYRVTVEMVEQAVTIGSRPGDDRPPVNTVYQRLSNTTVE